MTLRRRQLHIGRMIALLGAVCGTAITLTCDSAATAPTRDVRVTISGADTVAFGALGSQQQLTATVTVSEGELPVVSWRSTLPGVVEVSATGLLTSSSNGTARIIARAERVSDTVIAVVSQVPRRLTFNGEPTHAAVGVPLYFPVTVSFADSNDAVVMHENTSIEMQLGQNPGGAVLSGTVTVNALDGIARFDSLVLDAAGTGYTLIASAPALSATSIPFDVVDGPDVIAFRNTSGAPVGAVIDGQSTSFVNDYAIITTDSAATVVLRSAARGDEIIAFTEGRPPEIVTAPLWTANVDSVGVTFRDPISISVTAWIVAGPFEELRARAIAQAATTTMVWSAERMGLAFDEFEIVDATADPDASGLLSTTRCEQRSAARSSIGVRFERINIYYVSVVDNGHDRGYSCGDVIFMADRSGHELLVHEIGHSFGLGHIDTQPGYDQTNVMHSASSRRAFLTEGQVFRQHFDMSSALSVLYSIEPNGLRRCGDASVSDRCMELILRLWQDGTFPPNR